MELLGVLLSFLNKMLCHRIVIYSFPNALGYRIDVLDFNDTLLRCWSNHLETKQHLLSKCQIHMALLCLCLRILSRSISGMMHKLFKSKLNYYYNSGKRVVFNSDYILIDRRYLEVD